MDTKISGKVIHGNGYGKKIGYPTVNLQTKETKLPKEGVYAGTAILQEKKYRAGIVIGPSDKVEAHLIGYGDDAYGKIVTLKLGKFIRKYKKFKTEGDLIKQIEKDLKKC